MGLLLPCLELKILLTLLGFEGYHAPLADLKPVPKISATALKKACQALKEQGLLDYREEIKKFTSTPTSRILIQLDLSRSSLPVTPDELYVLKVCQRDPKTPADLKDIPPQDRQAVLQRLGGRDLIKLTQVQVTEVWLTPRALTYLRDECRPDRPDESISLVLLGHYVEFLRRSARPGFNPVALLRPEPKTVALPPSSPPARSRDRPPGQAAKSRRSREST